MGRDCLLVEIFAIFFAAFCSVQLACGEEGDTLRRCWQNRTKQKLEAAFAQAQLVIAKPLFSLPKHQLYSPPALFGSLVAPVQLCSRPLPQPEVCTEVNILAEWCIC